jgi:hypothetical protein
MLEIVMEKRAEERREWRTESSYGSDGVHPI